MTSLLAIWMHPLRRHPNNPHLLFSCSDSLTTGYPGYIIPSSPQLSSHSIPGAVTLCQEDILGVPSLPCLNNFFFHFQLRWLSAFWLFLDIVSLCRHLNNSYDLFLVRRLLATLGISSLPPRPWSWPSIPGAVTLCLLAILGIASLPSVTDRLTWREFTFIQSKLGWTALVAGSLHNLFLGWDYMLTAFACYLPSGLQVRWRLNVSSNYFSLWLFLWMFCW